MRPPRLAILALVAASVSVTSAADSSPPAAKGAYRSEAPLKNYQDRQQWESKEKDRFEYYGPNGLWQKLRASETLRIGRDTWFFWTGGTGQGGTQHFYRALSVNSGSIALEGKIQFYSLLQMSPKDKWEKLGLINEPGCSLSQEEEKGPTGKPLGMKLYKRAASDPSYPTNPEFGQSTGVVGLRLFPNPAFDARAEAQWDPKRYYANPAAMEPPHLVGISCAFCHMTFDPTNPPKDPVRPYWSNLAANLGNQYLHEGRLFFGAGQLFSFYEDRPLDEHDFVWQYGETQQRGTSETSRFSYDFINNPNTINSFVYVDRRLPYFERNPKGKSQRTLHVLKDGADSVGIDLALNRVFVNIGMEGNYWIGHLWNPVAGTRQSPILLDELRLLSQKDPLQASQQLRLKELQSLYGNDFGKSWKETEQRIPALISYLSSYTPMHLKDAPGGEKYLLDVSVPANARRMQNGKRVFAENCACCHSNRQPNAILTSEADRLEFYRTSVYADDFLEGNTLSDDRRYPLTLIKTNAARALAKNAIDGDIWAELSSRDYKALPPVGVMDFQFPVDINNTVKIKFPMPGQGRGYYRTVSLVNMWATAPYLHNNSVGPLTSDPSRTVPDPSVEERVKLFDLGIRELLWPEKRTPYVKVTSAKTTLLPPVVIKRIILNSLTGAIAHDFEAVFAKAVKEGHLSPQDAAKAGGALSQRVKGALSKTLDGFSCLGRAGVEAARKPENRQQIISRLETLSADTLAKVLPQDAQPWFYKQLQKQSPGIVDNALQGAQSLVDLNLELPEKFPVNLLLNLDVDKLPYAATQFVTLRNDPPALAAALLKLSECPDLIENHGHEFGGNLSDQDKNDLIEFLRTF
jgi:hypothetical protein